MASKRYSPADVQKIVRDKLANFRAKGIDAVEMHSLHPGGPLETLKELEREPGSFRDQVQQQNESGRDRPPGALPEPR